MYSTPKLWQILFFTILLFGSTYLAVSLGWYKGLHWIDMPLHFIGGIIIGMFWWWILDKRNSYVPKDKPSIFIGFIGFGAIVNYIWEIYEYLSWLYMREVVDPWILYPPTVGDVLSDIIITTAGVTVASTVYIRSLGRDKTV